MAVHAFFRPFNGGRMIALGVEPGGKFQDLPRTEFDAEATTLAAIFEDIYDTGCNLNVFRIKRNPPKYHGPSLKLELIG